MTLIDLALLLGLATLWGGSGTKKITSGMTATSNVPSVKGRAIASP